MRKYRHFRCRMFKFPRIADLFTSANLCCGTAAIIYAAQGELDTACVLVIIAAVFDVFDGLAARLFGGGSELGVQLDSLADMVSFGAAPAIMVFFQGSTLYDIDVEMPIALLVTALILTTASAWRLAKFNIDKRQTSGFLGLPTPSNGLFWVSMVAIANGIWSPGGGADTSIVAEEQFFGSDTLLVLTALVMSALMLSEWPLPGLKFNNWGWNGNQVRYMLLILGGSLLLVWQAMAVPMILFLYLVSPIWGRIFAEKA